jgi:hypothetical protein
MAGANGMTIVTAGGTYALRSLALRVEKASHSSDLRNDWRKPGDEGGSVARAAQLAKLSQIETSPREPLWNGPQLNAAFVAQVIGQILDDAAPAPSARAAYAHRARSPNPRVFDGLA